MLIVKGNCKINSKKSFIGSILLWLLCVFHKTEHGRLIQCFKHNFLKKTNNHLL